MTTREALAWLVQAARNIDEGLATIEKVIYRAVVHLITREPRS